VCNSKKSGRKALLTKNQETYLTDPRNLHKMRHLNLTQRAHRIKEHFKLKSFGTETLRRYYIRLGVHFKSPPVYYDAKYKDAANILKMQQDFARNLTHFLKYEAERTEIIYIDETTFNLWQTPAKVWFKEGMVVDIVRHRGPSISLIGALSNKRGIVHSSCFVGSNNEVPEPPHRRGAR